MGKRPRSGRSVPIAEAFIGRHAAILLVKCSIVTGYIDNLPLIIWAMVIIFLCKPTPYTMGDVDRLHWRPQLQ